MQEDRLKKSKIVANSSYFLLRFLPLTASSMSLNCTIWASTTVRQRFTSGYPSELWMISVGKMTDDSSTINMPAFVTGMLNPSLSWILNGRNGLS